MTRRDLSDAALTAFIRAAFARETAPPPPGAFEKAVSRAFRRRRRRARRAQLAARILALVSGGRR